MAKPWNLRLIETKRGRHMMETTPRYDVVLNGETVGQLTYNMRGFIGRIPTPGGGWMDCGERPITAWRREVAALNREARAAA